MPCTRSGWQPSSGVLLGQAKKPNNQEIKLLQTPWMQVEAMALVKIEETAAPRPSKAIIGRSGRLLHEERGKSGEQKEIHLATESCPLEVLRGVPVLFRRWVREGVVRRLEAGENQRQAAARRLKG